MFHRGGGVWTPWIWGNPQASVLKAEPQGAGRYGYGKKHMCQRLGLGV